MIQRVDAIVKALKLFEPQIEVAINRKDLAFTLNNGKTVSFVYLFLNSERITRETIQKIIVTFDQSKFEVVLRHYTDPCGNKCFSIADHEQTQIRNYDYIHDLN